ncbi:uncharacterized protein [Mytilus edulis]|uniref:uncharacterized protein n=1 Tax=Mytilus edulis TaxID=6550 RepID=UPI0039EF6801
MDQANDDKKHMIGIRKFTYWKTYGVKRFPYRGKRKYTPLVYQSDDGGIVISNDVFGLTIRQFERMYKDCLDRRKTHESWIMNLRYPDKASNEYLEYLDNCTDCNKEYLSWTENDSIENHLVNHLIRTIGTEIDIRKRQIMFILHDKIYNAHEENITKISSGSLAEGLDLPGSDVDIMLVDEVVNVTQIERNIKHPVQRTEVFMETDTDHPGFTRFRLIAVGKRANPFVFKENIVYTQTGVYLSTTNFVNRMKQSNIQRQNVLTHCPCLSDQNQTVDIAFCLRSKYLPYHAMPWTLRYRRQWPPNAIIDRIINYGCLLVPIGPRIMANCNLLWRISFSVAEKQLVHSFNLTQVLCYGLLKLTLKRIVNTNDDVKDLLCSYFLKTALFWVSEEVDIDTFQLPKLFICFSLCINKLISWVNNCYCPNYFLPEHNMFLGKINKYNNNSLLSALNSIKYSGINGLMQNLYHSYNCNISCYPPFSETSEQSILMLDLLIYKTSSIMLYNTGTMLSLTKSYDVLTYIESLQNSESTFNIGVCKFYYASISQYAAQLLPPPNTNYNIRTSYHRHLQNGLQRDTVTGWLLYASFYYETAQYNVTLKLTEYVLSKCLPDMVCLKRYYYNEADVDNYRHKVHSSMSLNVKMKTAVEDDVMYIQNSSLIPKELELDVEDEYFIVSPIIMAHCLSFLCYHHIGDTFNRQQALRHLCLTQYASSTVASNCLTLVGVCCEIFGDKDAAFHYYDRAMHCDNGICTSAEKRKLRLLKI